MTICTAGRDLATRLYRFLIQPWPARVVHLPKDTAMTNSTIIHDPACTHSCDKDTRTADAPFGPSDHDPACTHSCDAETRYDTITHSVNAEDCGPCLDGHDDETGRAYHQGVQDGQNFVLDQLEAMTAGYMRESPHMAAGRDILAQARRLTDG